MAVAAFGALGQETRLRVFRHLVQAGANGSPAGKIADQLGVLPNTLSTHLALLADAGLIRRQRDGRSIRYAADYAGIRRLLGYLMEDCCGGRPELCRPVIDAVACPC